MDFSWKNVKNGFNDLKNQLNQAIDSDLPDFPKNDRPWACQCGTVVDSKYEFCPKCGTSKKDIISKYLSKQANDELDFYREKVKNEEEYIQYLKDQISKLNEEINTLNGKYGDIKNNLEDKNIKYNSLYQKYVDLKSMYDRLRESTAAHTANMNNQHSKSYESYQERNTSQADNTNYAGMSLEEFLHNVFSGHESHFISSDDSVRLFNQAVEMKRAGRFDEALNLQRQSILAYPYDPELAGNFMAMGKVYYLKNDYSASFHCYCVYITLCALKNPAILQDYQAAASGNELAKMSLAGSFFNIAKNIGHALSDKDVPARLVNVINYYRNELMNKQLPNPELEALSNEYDKKLANIAYSIIENLFDKQLNDPNNCLLETKKYILKYTGLA